MAMLKVPVSDNLFCENIILLEVQNSAIKPDSVTWDRKERSAFLYKIIMILIHVVLSERDKMTKCRDLKKSRI